MQQKRTAQALASQREQTKRMTDSLTNSFLSFNSSESTGSQHPNSANKSSHRSNIGTDEDENVLRLVSSTPSPNREATHLRQKNKNSDDHNDGKQSNSKLTVQTSAVIKSASSGTKKLISPAEESRDSPATTATTTATSPTSDLEEDEAVVHTIPLTSSSQDLGPDDENNDPTKDKNTQKLPVVYSTPKKSERPKSSSFQIENGDGFDDAVTGKVELFPISASPKVFNNKARGNKSYDEGFPSDTIERDNQGKYETPKPKLNLMNSIHAFEQSFSIDFPDSFTPKEGNSDASSPASGSGQKIYNPFFATPEKPTSESSKMPQTEYRTPSKNGNDVPSMFDNNDKDFRPTRPEKTIPSPARARYERALGPRIVSSTQSKQPIGNEVEKSVSSGGNNTGVIYRRMQQRKRLGKNLESVSIGVIPVRRSVESSSSSEQKHQTRDDIVNIVDAFEQNESENADAGKVQQSSTASRFTGPIKSLRRRSVRKPISYAEPALNTKLRRGDTFFPKTSPDISDDAQNEVPNVIQTTAVVSP